MKINLQNQDEITFVSLDVTEEDIASPPLMFLAEIIAGFQSNPTISLQLKEEIVSHFGIEIYLEVINIIQKIVMSELMSNPSMLEVDMASIPIVPVVRVKSS